MEKIEVSYLLEKCILGAAQAHDDGKLHEAIRLLICAVAELIKHEVKESYGDFRLEPLED